MLETIKFLKESSDNLQVLHDMYGIDIKYNIDKTMMILDYDQIRSIPFRNHPFVIECRGLILNVTTLEIVIKSFDRFFNFGEADNDADFDWNDFDTFEKVDGSIMRVRFYEGDFFVATRNSFADSECNDSGKTWRELALEALDEDEKAFITMNPHITHVFEFCSPWNTIVVQHQESKMVLLGMFRGDWELPQLWIEDLKRQGIFRHFPVRHNFKSRAEVELYLADLTDRKVSEEGVVLKDKNGLRKKYKSEWYIQLHRLSGNGNIANLKNIVPLILQGETDEVLSYFPYLKPRVLEITSEIESLISDLVIIWKQCKDITDQKDFAIMITKTLSTPFSSVLFKLKRDDKIQSKEALITEFNKAERIIIQELKI